MNTPSHLIMTAALRTRLRPLPIPRGAFLLGAVLPDVPLWLLSVGGGLYFRYGREWRRAVIGDRECRASLTLPGFKHSNNVWLLSRLRDTDYQCPVHTRRNII